jgi:hypothetical protein
LLDTATLPAQALTLVLSMATTDDFYNSNPATELGECNDIRTILKHAYVLSIGGIVSCLCYLYIFHMYFIKKSPLLKRHPTSKFCLALVLSQLI